MLETPDPTQLGTYDRERLARAVAEARNWTDLMRGLGLKASGGQRRVLQERVVGHGLDTSHFVKRSPWRKYPDAAIAEAAASASSLREVALKLGATPATGTLSHIRRRISAAGIDVSHFERRSWGRAEPPAPTPTAHRVLIVLPSHAGRTNRAQLHKVLGEIGVPYACETCGNTGAWLGQPITLQIDHVNGNWHDNRRENLRYLCPNCHALTETWCRRKGGAPLAG
ncbi:HNH endonuclease [Streptomyces sp. E2N166]|uniref:HNH endonuclease n=1 Tax=Streptomyces sp. E2N166 TaxID=1851909 RepID=UPI000EF705D9|nr:HNH endonuclease [Streptomyces sp. E2N166]